MRKFFLFEKLNFFLFLYLHTHFNVPLKAKKASIKQHRSVDETRPSIVKFPRARKFSSFNTSVYIFFLNCGSLGFLCNWILILTLRVILMVLFVFYNCD